MKGVKTMQELCVCHICKVPDAEGEVAVGPRVGDQLQEDGRVGGGLVGEAPPQLQTQGGVQRLAVQLRLGN